MVYICDDPHYIYIFFFLIGLYHHYPLPVSHAIYISTILCLVRSKKLDVTPLLVTLLVTPLGGNKEGGGRGFF